MSQIEFPNLIRFFMQLGGAIAGASALWGFILALKGQKLLARSLMRLFIAGFIIFLLSWFLAINFFFIPELSAHEGVKVATLEGFIQSGLALTFPLVLLAIFLFFIGAFYYLKNRRSFGENSALFFLILFLLMSAILAFSSWTGTLTKEQVFFSLHGWHSILTLGTIITVDFLFLKTQANSEQKRFLYPFFHAMSSFIWLGLGIDFASAFLVFDEWLEISNQFLFNQTAVGIIILNGAVLSGRINGALVDLVHGKRAKAPTFKMNFIFGLCGAISIVSWLFITFLDFFELEFSYLGFLGVYLLVIAAAFLFQYPLKKLRI